MSRISIVIIILGCDILFLVILYCISKKYSGWVLSDG